MGMIDCLSCRATNIQAHITSRDIGLLKELAGHPECEFKYVSLHNSIQGQEIRPVSARDDQDMALTNRISVLQCDGVPAFSKC
jgi:hypothetical protein